MDFFDRHKALIITTLLFSVILLSMYNIKISNSNKETSRMLVQLENFEEEEEEETELKEQEIQEETPRQNESTVETHRAFNQNREETQEEFQSRLDEIFEENSAENEASEEENTEPSEGEFSLNKNSIEERQKQSDGDNSSEEISAKSGVMENSSISFNLLERRAIAIPNPIYTCDTPGKIVVNITVNAEGAVTNTSINEASSSSTNECLTNQAMEYAAGARFTNLAGRNAQPGTITYSFQGQ